MGVLSALRMNEGDGETSYARNSYLQSKALLITKHIKEEAIRNMYLSIGRKAKNIAIADFGCSSKPDALWLFDLIKTIDHGFHHNQLSSPPPNFTVYLNDLPGNDFNTIFKSVLSFKEKQEYLLMKGRHCFIHGVPGSFYGRLFESQSLHFAHSSFAVHWLSQVPNGITRSNTTNIYISSRSSESVAMDYYHQFQRDFWTFLTCRAEEIIDGGCMVLTLVGRRSEDRSSKEACSVFELLAIALNQLASEGLIDKEKMDSFNLPIYHPSLKEIEDVVEDEGSFTVERTDVSDIDWEPTNSPSDLSSCQMVSTNSDKHIVIVRCMRAVTEPILTDHFGGAIIEEVFKRYNDIVADQMTKERNFHVVVTVSLSRKERDHGVKSAQ